MMNKESVAKETKKGLVDYIVNTAKESKLNKDLTSRVNYTLKGLEKDEKAVPKSTLKELAEDIIDFLNTAVSAPAPVEASAKPALKKAPAKAPEKVAETPAPAPAKKAPAKKTEDAPAKTAEAPKKGLKAPAKKADAKVETAENITKKDLPMAKIFPKEIDHKSLGHLTACFGQFDSVKSINEAVEAGKELILATYWTKRHIKEFAYGAMHEVPVPKDGFPHDLDTLQIVYICDGTPQFYAISTYTEAMFRFKEEDLEYLECEAPNGDKFRMRYTAGLEFEVYEITGETVVEPEPEKEVEAPAPAPTAPKKTVKKGAK